MLALKRSTFLLLLLTLAACVTVNIYFPAAAAEKAAEQFVRDVWQEQSEESKSAQPKNENKTHKNKDDLSAHFDPRNWLLAVFSLASNTAYANPDFNVTSPEIARLKASIQARFAQLKPFFDSGALGLGNDGYISVRNAGAAAMNQRAAMQQLVNAENHDRKALYQAIAAANHQPGWFDDIRKQFVKQWNAQARSGWWIQQANGNWVQK